MDETEKHPLRNQPGLPGYHAVQQGLVRLRGLRDFRVVPGDRIIGQYPCGFCVAPYGEVLESAYAKVACRYPREESSRQGCIAKHAFPRGDCGQGPRGWHTQRRHRLTHDVLAQDRTERGSPVAAPREWSGARALKLDVVTHAVVAHHLAKQVCAAVPEPRHNMS